ncbi:hypothetical protein SLEP1_g15516 [Rubroshorea leprosula]|uniref:WRKY domain-containing protein n=1 Tax=Rubroshorea leprosula TaxID=152421 RepID=A0AAV5IWS6_9ROSI|nr:hypothetical protein SLEP1_g15516 [Rubroshorea leprosula]
MDSNWVDTSLDLNLNPFPGKPKKTEPVEDLVVLQGKELQMDALMEEFNQLRAENRKLTEMLTIVCENYTSLQNQFMELKNKNSENEVTTSRKRKGEAAPDDCANMIGFSGRSESSSSDEESIKRPKESSKSSISTVCVRTSPSDTSLILRDGYQWRKYGQKVTRDNPSPRAYFKCSYAPSCPVKKKVQKSAEDPSILVATYEGEHNHACPSQAEVSLSSTQTAANPCRSVPISAPVKPSAPSVTLDLLQPSFIKDVKKSSEEMDSADIQKLLVHQMAASLVRDPNFTAALASAISGGVLEQSRIEKC